MRFSVKYSYLATGMEGRADTKDYGSMEADTADDAIDQVVLREYPTDIMYGPNDSWSTREFFRRCLTATEDRAK